MSRIQRSLRQTDGFTIVGFAAVVAVASLVLLIVAR